MAVATAPTATPLPLDAPDVERLGRWRGEPAWLVESRLASLARYTPDTWPTGSEEEWRRFPLEGVPSEALIHEPAPNPPTEYTSVPLDAAHHGVVFDRWVDAVREHPDLVRRWLPDGSGHPSHAAFRAIVGAAFAHGSTFLYVPVGVEVELPLHVHKRWAAGTRPIVFRTVVVAEAGSSVTFVEELSSEGGGPGRLAVPGVEIHAGPGARVRYVRIQRFGDDVWDLGYQRAVSERDSSFSSFNVLVGSKRTKTGVESDIRGDGAEVRLNGLVAAADEQRIDVNSFQRVDGKASTSDLLYLSALYGASKAVFYGVIRVEATSSGTGSYQECRNMLLSDKAGADPIPVLEILTNDVARCGHGATAGAIDDAELFYVMTRGLDRSAAEQLLVHGFFQRVVNAIPEPQVRARVLAALEPRIGRALDLDLELEGAS
ncbi:MAG TPA: SufD family Fe-S cluster assembly protein [Candidatus Limnocylindria bacterium]|nr:SufD family Fe-S cluster assembly protein [Candidatus Limnocylindria bacterium]